MKTEPEDSTQRTALNLLFTKDRAFFELYANHLVPIITASGERGVAKFVALQKGSKPAAWRRFYKAEELLASALLDLASERKNP